jgi:hypothetical protein
MIHNLFLSNNLYIHHVILCFAKGRDTELFTFKSVTIVYNLLYI